MDAKTPEVIKEIRKILAENPGLRGKWKQLAQVANQRGIKTPRRAAWSGASLGTFCARAHLSPTEAGEVISDASEISDTKAEPIISDKSDVSNTKELPLETSDASDVSKMRSPRPEEAEPDEPPLPETWQRQIREMIQAEVRRLMEIQTLQTFPTVPLPPERVKTQGEKGRPVGRGERVKIGVTLDRNLFDRFEQERKRLGLSASGFADVVLWNFLGQPPMSYEVDEKPDAQKE